MISGVLNKPMFNTLGCQVSPQNPNRCFIASISLTDEF